MKKIIFFILIALIVIVSGAFYLLDRTGVEGADADIPPDEILGIMPSLTASESPTPTCSPTPIMFFYVHVCGHVVSPGVYAVQAGSRLEAAIEKAGGFLWSADQDYLNLARLLTDGERVYVPSVYETEVLSLSDRMCGEKTLIESEHMAITPTPIRIVNINKDSLSDIQTLPGIGEKKAQDIIKYRENVGPFDNIDEIKNISGIGEALFLKIKDLITVE